MVSELKRMQSKLDQKKGERCLLIKQKDDLIKELRDTETSYDTLLKAREVVRIVAENTQKKLEYHFTNLVSLALNIFPDPYKFELRFTQRRNKTEADLIWSKNGHESDDIMDVAGGGVVDIAGLALEFACQGLSNTSPVVILDEPAKFLSVDLQEKASEMIKLLSKELGLQIIMVSHLPNMIASADNVIEIENIKGESILKEDSDVN